MAVTLPAVRSMAACDPEALRPLKDLKWVYIWQRLEQSVALTRLHSVVHAGSGNLATPQSASSCVVAFGCALWTCLASLAPDLTLGRNGASEEASLDRRALARRCAVLAALIFAK